MPTFFAALTLVITQDARTARRILLCVPVTTMLWTVSAVSGTALCETHGLASLAWVFAAVAAISWIVCLNLFAARLADEFGF